MALPAQKTWTVEDYLAFDRASEFRHEMINGQVYRKTIDGYQLIDPSEALNPSVHQTRAMAGASRAHNLISLNIGAELRQKLRNSPCETYAGDMRVQIEASDYFYPDVMVTCDEARFHDEENHVVRNPIVIFEVLSPSTEKYDRGAKAQRYRSLPSLQTYVLVSQESSHVEVYTRHGDGFWMLTEAMSLVEGITIPALNVVLPLSEIYDRVFTADNT